MDDRYADDFRSVMMTIKWRERKYTVHFSVFITQVKSEIKISENKTYSKTKILLTTNNFCFIYYVVSFVPPQGETGRLRRHVFYLFVHPFVCYQTCEQDILKTNEPLLMHTWCTGQGQEAINSGSGVQRSTVTWGWNWSQKYFSVRYLKNCLTKFNPTWQAQVTVTGRCVTTAHKVKSQCRMSLTVDLEARQSLISLGEVAFVVLSWNSVKW